MENTNINTPKYDPREYIDLADKTYLDYIKGGKYNNILSSMATLGDYSLRNQMLILNQLPAATKVNSMSGWNFSKRSIQKGTKSIKILAPIFNTVVKTENGQVTERKSDYVSGFKINFVYDVSQTEEKHLDGAQTESKNVEPYYYVIPEALTNCLKYYTITEDEIEGDGVLDTRQKTITLNKGLSKERILKTLIDQTAAALVLGRNRDNFQGLRSDTVPNIVAIEISAISAIVCKRLGLESQAVQEPDFSKMTDLQISKFANNIGVMRSISQRMILAIDNAIGEAMTLDQLTSEGALENQENVVAEPKINLMAAKTKTAVKAKAQAQMGD